MYYEFKDTIKNIVYWSNSLGDLHHNADYDIKDVKELPFPLQQAFKKLWLDGTYLIEFNGHYGVAIEASYDEDFARVLSISYDKLKESVRKKVEEYAQKYPELDVIFGEDATKWNDGSSETIILVICPWYMNKEHFLDINEYIENTRYVDLDIEKKSEEKTENIETPEIVETGCKKIYSFDNYEGDKGIIIATSLEEASMIYKEKYPYRTIAQSEEQYYNNGCYILERYKLDNATLVVTAEW